MKATFKTACLLLLGSLVIISCHKKDTFNGMDTNTDRPMVEFPEGKDGLMLAMEFSNGFVELDLADLRFMTRSRVDKNATVKIAPKPELVYDYNDANGTSYEALNTGLYEIKPGLDIQLTPEHRTETLRIRLKPSDIFAGAYAIGLTITMADGAEINQIRKDIVIRLAVTNKYDGVYHLKGRFTRTDNPALNGPFETEVHMITTGANSVAMFWPEADGWAQPFTNNGNLTAFSNVAPEVYFNTTTNAITSLVNITGNPAPLMTVFPGSNSRYDESGVKPVIYLKYYYNPDPTNRIFADTLTYVGPR